MVGSVRVSERAIKKLTLVVPVTLAIIFVLLYLTFRSVTEAALIMVTLPFALIGGLWLLFLLSYNLSIASAIGFIAPRWRVGGVWGRDADLSRSCDSKAPRRKQFQYRNRSDPSN